MTLKRENDYSNAISVPKLVENKVLRQILGPLFQKLKIEDGRRWSFWILPRFLRPRHILSENLKLFSEKKCTRDCSWVPHYIYISLCGSLFLKSRLACRSNSQYSDFSAELMDEGPICLVYRILQGFTDKYANHNRSTDQHKLGNNLSDLN